MRREVIECAGALVFRRLDNGAVEILLQRRRVQDHSYDPLYNDTWETPSGQTEKGDGDLLETALRETSEECGLEGTKILRIHGTVNCESSREGEKVVVINAFSCSVQEVGPQPWLMWLFVFEVDPNWTPEIGDGEAGGFRWVTPNDLIAEISSRPETFFGPHRAAQRRLAQALLAGHFAPRS